MAKGETEKKTEGDMAVVERHSFTTGSGTKLICSLKLKILRKLQY